MKNMLLMVAAVLALASFSFQFLEEAKLVTVESKYELVAKKDDDKDDDDDGDDEDYRSA